MELGVSTASFFGKEFTENSLPLVEKLGMNLCEVFLTTFCEYEKEFIDLLSSRKGNIEIYSLHALNVQFEPELFNRAERTRKDCEYFFKKIAKAANALNASYYTFHGPVVMKRLPYTVDFDWVGRRLDELDELLYAESNGKARLAYENVHWTMFHSPEYFAELKKHTSVHTCLDIKQAMQSRYDVYDYIDVMGDRLANVHVCDYDADGKLAVPGKGSFDFVKLFCKLIDKGYDGAVIMELYANNYAKYDEVVAGYEYLSNCYEIAKHKGV